MAPNRLAIPYLWRRLLPIILFLLIVLTVGTVGYALIEGWSPLDAFYMTVITLSTVGFGEVQTLSGPGRLFTVVLILSGVAGLAFTSAVIAEYALTMGLADQLRRRRTMRVVDKLENHVIVCGFGRVGQNAALTLPEGKRPFVIIDGDKEAVESALKLGYNAIHGDATQDGVLQEAGIDRAWGMLICTGNDVSNLFIVLSARTLNPDLYIVGRSTEAGNEAKLRRAGANKVVSPYQIGGRHMANCIVRPHITEFMDIVTFDSGLELWLEEIEIAPDSDLIGQTVVESDLRRRTGVTLMIIHRAEGQSALMPSDSTRLEAADRLIVLGTREQLSQLEQIAGVSVLEKVASGRKSK